jgi:hypothetical protein
MYRDTSGSKKRGEGEEVNVDKRVWPRAREEGTSQGVWRLQYSPGIETHIIPTAAIKCKTMKSICLELAFLLEDIDFHGYFLLHRRQSGY